MKVREILDRINLVAPWALAENWDNVGLMAGDPDLEVGRLALALDPLPEALEEASRRGCQALLSHHPLFFQPVRSLDFSQEPGRVVYMAAKAGMAVLAAHTNWDSAENGVSRILAERLKLIDIVPLVPSESGAGGLGAVGNFSAPSPVRDVLRNLQRDWEVSRADCYGPVDCSILRVALCGGSGGSLWPLALSAGAGLYLTADMKYHEILDCVRSGLSVAIVDHAEMESVTLSELAKCIEVPGQLETVLMNYRSLATPVRL